MKTINRQKINPTRLTRARETQCERRGGKRYCHGPMLNYETFILLEVFEDDFFFFFFSNVWKHSKTWLMACPEMEKENLNWPTFVTSLRAGTLIRTTPDLLEKQTNKLSSHTATGVLWQKSRVTSQGAPVWSPVSDPFRLHRSLHPRKLQCWIESTICVTLYGVVWIL